MKRREVLFAVIGGVVGAVLVMAVGAIAPLGAQSQSDSFGEITCTGLKVVDSDGRMQIILSATSSRGSVLVFGKEGFAHVGVDKYGGAVSVAGYSGDELFGGTGVLGISKYGGDVLVKSEKHDGHAGIGLNEHGGRVQAAGDNTNVVMRVNERGGRVAVYGNDGKQRVGMGVNEYGNGAVSTWDKNGYRLATLK